MSQIVKAADLGMSRHLDGSRLGLKRIGSPRGAQFDAAGGFMNRAALSVYEDDFFIDTTANYTKSKSVNATDWNWAAGTQDIVAANGTLTGSTSASGAGEGISLFGKDLCFSGQLNAGCEVRIKLDVVTNYVLEFGFIDALTTKTAQLVTDIDVPTLGAGATEVAVVAIDLSQTLKKFALVSLGGTGAGTTALSNTPAMTAATYATIRVQTNGTAVYGCVLDNNGVLVGEAYQAAGILGTVAMAPWLGVWATTAAAKVPVVDYIRRWSDRLA